MHSFKHPIQPESFYTLPEAARFLGVHYETAARWVRAGKLPAVKLSRRKTLIPKEGCHALLATQGAGATAAVAPGSPLQWLPWIGTLTAKEAARLRELAEDFEKLDEGS